MLYYGSEFVRMDQVIASMFVIFFIGVVADRVLFMRLEVAVRSNRGLTS
jgi:ABC-type nitrate/sulfonate/bicarbonate transport system permease component